MTHFFVFKLKKSKSIALLLLLSLCTALFIWIESESNFSVFSSKENPAALSQGNPDDPSIALTFNISWGTEMVEPTLEVLKKHDVTTTFFLIGEWAEHHPDLVEKIEANGHEIGMMGYRYESYVKQEIEQVRKDLAKAQDTFASLGYSDLRLLRTPSGHLNSEVMKLAENQGYDVIQWNVNPRDWENPGTQVIIDHVLKNTNNGDIILLNASDSVKQTPKALETILPTLKQKGLSFVTISELISRAQAENNEVRE
ncbi:Peptidoglycan-N-acetylmuramic acid deacetylase PdaA precursor [Paraliobacillus sp. PM-2]|uniref:polysaccharide deacetylase family sporulation protein PdaB n=1 Tax=Paraliobacillus sp. PM-2 TaxID=1462524 RepID=UPI00061C879E|nr:polysaccharide deacetylase family sporulation protein PdaB [Paraliobacillus sp. PM-2]CQR48474.1 Peptidoglycan-N-acetylmuramic acid deacetylase PdaA precursor [Paraliobacillus sp. PM-2]